MKGCRWRGLMGLPLVAAPNADFQVILRRKSHAAHLLSISENPFNASRWYLLMHEPAFDCGFFDIRFKPTSTLQICRENATVREAKRSNLYMTVIEYHRKYFDHIINVTLIGKEEKKKGIVILCCHSERHQSTRGIVHTKKPSREL